MIQRHYLRQCVPTTSFRIAEQQGVPTMVPLALSLHNKANPPFSIVAQQYTAMQTAYSCRKNLNRRIWTGPYGVPRSRKSVENTSNPSPLPGIESRSDGQIIYWQNLPIHDGMDHKFIYYSVISFVFYNVIYNRKLTIRFQFLQLSSIWTYEERNRKP
jgi:hypothetical protein